jgi:ABC-type glutathione transport system ATPase component
MTLVLQATDLEKTVGRPQFPFFTGNQKKIIQGVSLQVGQGESVGLVGPSGSGKTTFGRLILALLTPSAGRVEWKIGNDWKDPNRVSAPELRLYRKDFQIVFQNPHSALNPRKAIRNILIEPLRLHYPELVLEEALDSVHAALSEVGLPEDSLMRRPDEFSGGQRQRICLARVLLLKPRFVVLDEVTSLLDMTVQEEIINLLASIQNQHALSMLFITHNILLAQSFCDRILVLSDGQIVESLARNAPPQHPITLALWEQASRLNDKVVMR